jgi:ketosteroid isomerase-like protein
MRKLTAALMMMCMAGLACADSPAPSGAGTTKDQGVAEQLKQLENDWADAMKQGDVDKIDQIVAEDWTGLGPAGRKLSKKTFIADMKSGKGKGESTKFGPMDVKVMGHVAVVQGTETTGTNMKMAWMDVFAERQGKWVAIGTHCVMAE